MKKEIILYSKAFKPCDDFESELKKLNIDDYKNIRARMNPNLIEFIKNKNQIVDGIFFYNSVEHPIYKVAYIVEVDTSKNWTIEIEKFPNMIVYDKYERICYLDIKKLEDGFTIIKKTY